MNTRTFPCRGTIHRALFAPHSPAGFPKCVIPSGAGRRLVVMSPKPVIPSGAGRRFFFHVLSCERVGLRREESLFDFNFVFPDPKSSRSSSSRSPHPLGRAYLRKNGRRLPRQRSCFLPATTPQGCSILPDHRKCHCFHARKASVFRTAPNKKNPRC